MRIAAALLFSLILVAPALAASERRTWYEKSGYYFRVSDEGRETDNTRAWACGGTAALQQWYIISFRSSAVGQCGPQTVWSLSWHPGQEVSAAVPCEGLESAWKQFRGAKGENPSAFLDSHDGRPSGRQIARYFDEACRGKRIQPTEGKP